jgi:phosphoribosylformylglycinamidine cyclo-ligase
VGTKLKVAVATGRHDTVGIDLVAMSVNDIITVGAEPLFFLDYLATGRLDVDAAEHVVAGIAEGCRQAGCALLGGETAEMPGMYAPGEYDLAGFAVGVAERARIIDGRATRPGHAVIGLPSSGLHSNGYSLARRVLLECGPDLSAPLPELGRGIGDELLEPTRIYVKPVRELLGAVEVTALAHITGGGLADNPPRVVPVGLGFRLDRSTWVVPPVMRLIAERGGVPEDDMWRTFNMGLGMLAVVPAEQADAAVECLRESGGRIVGEIRARAAGTPAVEIVQ